MLLPATTSLHWAGVGVQIQVGVLSGERGLVLSSLLGDSFCEGAAVCRLGCGSPRWGGKGHVAPLGGSLLLGGWGAKGISAGACRDHHQSLLYWCVCRSHSQAVTPWPLRSPVQVSSSVTFPRGGRRSSHFVLPISSRGLGFLCTASAPRIWASRALLSRLNPLPWWPVQHLSSLKQG